MLFAETKANTSSKISSSELRHVKNVVSNVRVIVRAAQKYKRNIRKPHGKWKLYKIESDCQLRKKFLTQNPRGLDRSEILFHCFSALAYLRLSTRKS